GPERERRVQLPGADLGGPPPAHREVGVVQAGLGRRDVLGEPVGPTPVAPEVVAVVEPFGLAVPQCHIALEHRAPVLPPVPRLPPILLKKVNIKRGGYYFPPSGASRP